MKHNRPNNRASDRLRTYIRRSQTFVGPDPLVADLAGYRSEAELLELSAILSRHDDAVAAPVRDAINWTPAA